MALVAVAPRVPAADDFTQLIRVSPDQHFLMQPDGTPFFWLADTGWSLFQRLTREEAEAYLKDRADKGFTVIQAAALGGPADPTLGQGSPPAAPNAYGELPLIDEDPLRPNTKYFDHIDWIVAQAAKHGIRIAMLPVWGANVVGGWVNGGTPIFTTKNAAAYGRWLGARYRGKGVLWIFGGDTNPIGAAPYRFGQSSREIVMIDYRPVWDALAKGIADGEGDTPFITYHPTCCAWAGTAPPRTSLYLADRHWLTLNFLQSSHFKDPDSVMALTGATFAWEAVRNYEPVYEEYRSQPTKPIIDGEPRYEDLAVDVEADPATIGVKGYWQAYDTRNAAYHALFAGAAGHTYGNHSVWQFYDPAKNTPIQAARVELPWQKAIQAPGAAQMQHAKRLLLSRPYFTRIPDQSLIVAEQGVGESHVSATRDRSGRYAMVYLPKGAPVKVDLTRLSGAQAHAWWFDPRTGVATAVGANVPTSTEHTFTPPSSGADQDWVLVVDDAGQDFGTPGQPTEERGGELQGKRVHRATH